MLDSSSPNSATAAAAADAATDAAKQQQTMMTLDEILELANESMRQGQQILYQHQQQQYQQHYQQQQQHPYQQPQQLEQHQPLPSGGGEVVDPLEYFQYAHSLLGKVVALPGSRIIIDDDPTSSSKDQQPQTPAEQQQPDEEDNNNNNNNSNKELRMMTTLAYAEVCRVIAGIHIRGSSSSQYHMALPYLQQSHRALLGVLGPKDPRTVAIANDVEMVQYILSSVLLYNNNQTTGGGGKGKAGQQKQKQPPQQHQIRRSSSSSITTTVPTSAGAAALLATSSSSGSNDQEEEEEEETGVTKEQQEEEEEEEEGILLHWFERDDYDDTDRAQQQLLAKQQQQQQPDQEQKPLGISIDWIKRGFWKQLKACSKEWSPYHTVQQLVDSRVIQSLQQQQSQQPDNPHEGFGNSSYMDRLRGEVDNKATGPASVLVSYSNETTIGDIINSLDDYCRTNQLDDRTIFVWLEFLCCCSSPQHPQEGMEQNKREEEEQVGETAAATTTSPGDPQRQPQQTRGGDDNKMKERVSPIGHVLAILQPWYQPNLWQQPKCLREVMLAAELAAARNGDDDDDDDDDDDGVDGGGSCKLTLALPPAQIVALSDALVGNPSAQIDQLYRSLDAFLTMDQQRIFRPWVRNVIQAQVKEHCNHSTVLDDEDGEITSDEQKQKRQQAMNVFQLQLCNKMGLLFWQYGEYKTSLELLEDALSISESLYGQQNHESTATVYQNIANVLADMGRYQMAIQTYTTALQILNTLMTTATAEPSSSSPPPPQPPPPPPSVASSPLRTITGAMHQPQPHHHRPHHQHHHHHPRIAGLCSKLGNLYRITNQLDKAMEYHQRALTIHQQERKLLREEKEEEDDGGSGSSAASVQQQEDYHSSAVADCYKDMGSVFFSKGDNDAALMELRKALKIQQQQQQQQYTTGPSSSRDGSPPTIFATSTTSLSNPTAVAATLNQIGLVLKTKGDFEGALAEFRTALTIQEEALGQDHIQTTMTNNNIIGVLERQDDYETALEIAKKSQAIYMECLGPNHPTTAAGWHTLAGIQNELDQVEDALESYQQALKIRQQQQSSGAHGTTMEHSPLLLDTAETLQSMGTLLFEIGDLDEALVQLQQAFDIVEPVLGLEHPTTKRIADKIDEVLEA